MYTWCICLITKAINSRWHVGKIASFILVVLDGRSVLPRLFYKNQSKEG